MGAVTIRGVPETMLQTLWARAMETQKPKPHFSDPTAVDILRKLDYNFAAAEHDKAMSTGVIARTILLDRMTGGYLRSHPDTVVVNLACGLDTRCCRMAGQYKRWYNVDLPEAMEVRKRFLTESDSVRQIACSAMDPAWADQIDCGDHPVLVIIEGLTMYLKEEDVKQIFSIIREHFPRVLVFVETMNPWVQAHMKEKSIENSQAKFTWGVKNGEELKPLVPGFRHLTDLSLVEGMKVFLPVYRFLGKFSFVRNISNKILVFEK